MMKIIHKSESRGYNNMGWLDTRHTFSFAQYYNPKRMNFGVLRVLNDDVVKPGRGFDLHPHDNMEIISIPLKGALLHTDSMGHQQLIKENEVQVMSAGTGIFHSEYNASKEDDVNFLQIWLYPKKQNVKPVYNQQYFNPLYAVDKWQVLISPNGGSVLNINQDAYISRLHLSAGNTIGYKLHENTYGCYIFIIEGKIEIDGTICKEKDGIGIYDTNKISIKALNNAYIINFEVPNIN